MKKHLTRLAILFGVVMIFVVMPLITLDEGDWLGPLERTARELFGGWDMWESPVVRPYEAPLPATPPGVVPTTGLPSYGKALQAVKTMPLEAQVAGGAKAFGKFCQHCHGVNGDGRAIVGESFDVKLPDLRKPAVQEKPDGTLFATIFDGTNLMIPLGSVVRPTDLVLAIKHIKTLKQAPSVPFYPPQSTEPLQ